MRGQCKLCLQKDVELLRSHGVPAAIYRAVRGDSGQGNPNPYLLTHKGTVQTSFQDTARLLCKECEQRFSSRGERWVLANSLRQDDSFKIMDVLKKRSPDASSLNFSTKIYYGKDIPEINVDALVYFAVSMFWRATLYPWSSYGTVSVKLGPYAEQFRRFLLDEIPFPDESVLWVIVREPAVLSKLTFAPYSEKRYPNHVHKFTMPGLAFTLITGHEIPAHFASGDIVRGFKNPLILGDLLEEPLFAMAQKMVDQARG